MRRCLICRSTWNSSESESWGQPDETPPSTEPWPRCTKNPFRTHSIIIYLEYDADRREGFFVQQWLIKRERERADYRRVCKMVLIQQKSLFCMIGIDSLNWVSGYSSAIYSYHLFNALRAYSSSNQGHSSATSIRQAFIINWLQFGSIDDFFLWGGGLLPRPFRRTTRRSPNHSALWSWAKQVADYEPCFDISEKSAHKCGTRLFTPFSTGPDKHHELQKADVIIKAFWAPATSHDGEVNLLKAAERTAVRGIVKLSRMEVAMVGKKDSTQLTLIHITASLCD